MGRYIPTAADYWKKLLVYVFVALMGIVHSHGIDTTNITILENAISKGAVCLDGSPAGYHYAKGFGDGANNWMVYLPGGAWCGSKYGCLARVNSTAGSTKDSAAIYFAGILSSKQTYNPDFYNWNRVYVRYCDSSSFTGDVEAVDQDTNLHLRGARIFGAVMEDLLAKGLKNANNAILVGNSAGGLATILNCDRFRALIPNVSRVKCIADSGFFIRAKNLPGAKKREETFAKIVAFHGITKALPTSCTSRMDPSLCFFPENLIGDIQTPLFLLNSDFDQYQISVNLKPHPADKQGWQNCTSNIKNCTPAQLQIIKDFRTTFLETLKEIGDNPSRGMFINSCYIHDFLYSSRRWNGNGSPRVGNKTIAEAIGDWYFERSYVQEIDTHNDYPLLNCPL